MKESSNEIGTTVEHKMNWGALTLTPLWLIRNGFLLSFLFYILLSIFVWPLSIAVSILFFIKGSEWSWGGGRRWKNYEEFSESQFTWNFVGIIIILLSVSALLWTSYPDWFSP